MLADHWNLDFESTDHTYEKKDIWKTNWEGSPKID